MFRSLVAAIAVGALALPALAGDIATSVSPEDVSDSRKTPFGLYLTATDAHAALTRDPGIVFIDARGLIEVNFVGMPDSADKNVPVLIQTHTYDPEKKRYEWRENPDFIAQVDAVLEAEGKTRDDPIFVMCRSGGRSAMAVRALAEAGFGEVYNIIDGFEGGKHSETGHRTVEGWRNSDLPWSYGIPPEKAWRPAS